MPFPDDVPTLTDGTVTLRAHGPQDVAGVLEQCLDPVSQEWTTVPVPYSLADARTYTSEIVPTGWDEGTGWSFAVEAPDDDGVPRFCGTVELRDEGDRRAEIAYGSHPWARGRGVMERALRLLLEWGFSEKRLQTVIWWANEGNWASRKLAWRLGFSFDGTVRRWLPQRGALLDAWVGVLLSGDERQPRHPWYDVPRIVGRTVVLRAHEPRDAPRVLEAGMDARARHWLALPEPYTIETARDYIESRCYGHALGTMLSWAVADPDTDELVANISLMKIKPGEDAEIGYWTHPADRGRGVMTEACGLAVRHAFVPVEDGGLGLRRLTVLHASENTASQHVVEANGFVRAGLLREEYRLGDGTLADTVVYDLLASEYAGTMSLR